MDADEQRTIRLKQAMDAARRLGALIQAGQGQVDDVVPGSELAEVLFVLSMVWPAHRPRRPCRN